MKKIALIPARSGSKRIKDKNITLVQGHPLLAYTIHNALLTNLFDRVIVLSDSISYAEVARKYGAETPYIRDVLNAHDESPDIDWVLDAIDKLKLENEDVISILRPTSPLRDHIDITSALSVFFEKKHKFDSLRALSAVSEHPGKMWRIVGEQAIPVFCFERPNGVPWHSSQTNTLPVFFVQNASMEFVSVGIVRKTNKISGDTIVPFVMDGYSALDINVPGDLEFLNFLIEKQRVSLPIPQVKE